MKYTLSRTPNSTLQDLSSRIRLVRKKAGYSQQEMAKRSGVSLGSIKRFETKHLISLESLLKIAHVLGRLEEFQSLFLYDETREKAEELIAQKW